nr:efflux RND transporter periplasmic adaptor subunit [Sphingomonas leidyi]
MALAAVLAACGGGRPDDRAEPSALVTVVRPVQGSLPMLVEAYGTAAAAGNGQQTISISQPGQVLRLLVTAGVAVRSGQPLLVFAVAPTARSAYAQAADAVKAATSQRDSTAQLLGQQLATRDQLAQAEKALADARAQLAALRAEGAGSGTITFRAPFDGVVATVPVAAGDRTQPGAALATVARSGAMVITTGVDPAQRDRIRVGAEARLTRMEGGGTVTGHVVRVDSILNPVTRQVDVDIAYPAGSFLAGEAVRVATVTGEAHGWIVPHKAVAFDANGKAMLFQIAGGKARAVPVQLLASTPERDVVSGPVAPGQPLILDGAYQVADGDAVRTSAAK